MEKLPRQAVYIADVAVLRKRFGIHVVRREVIAAWNQHAVQHTILTRHAMQAFNAAHYCHERHQIVVAVHQQLGPRPLHGHLLHLPAVVGQSSVRDDIARFQQPHRATIRQLVERHRQFEIVGAHTDRRAGQCDALTVAGELKLRQLRLQLIERNAPVGENEHAAASHTAVHASRHLQQFIRAQMNAREHVATLVHHVGEARVIDDHRVEPLDRDRALSCRRHREKERLRHAAFVQILTDHADRLTTVIVLRVNLRETLLYMTRRVLGASARRQKHRHTTTLGNHLLQELVVEKIGRAARLHFHRRLLRLIEAVHFENVAAAKVLRVERRIDRGREPDVAAACPLAEREAEFQLGRCLMDLVNDDGVVMIDIAVLKPPSRDAGGDDDHVALRRLRSCFALAIHDADFQRFAQDCFGDWSHCKRLAGAGSRHDAESLTAGREFTQPRAMILLQVCLDIERERQLDGFARRAGRGDDDDASASGPSRLERIRVGREVSVANVTHATNLARARPVRSTRQKRRQSPCTLRKYSMRSMCSGACTLTGCHARDVVRSSATVESGSHRSMTRASISTIQYSGTPWV